LIDAAFVSAVTAIVGPLGVITDANDMASYTLDWRGNYSGKTSLVVRPQTTEEVAAIVALCARTGTAIVPQGGNTGLVGGSIPDESGAQIVLSLKRMNKVRAVDTENNTMVVEAGCILKNVQQAAIDCDRYFPLSLAAEGSCTIGGNLSTNAGGTAVLRYGNARDLVLGVEVVTAKGEIWDGLRSLRKDNTGYDLKHLYMGSEGTLGIITAAVLKLYPAARTTCTAFVAVPSPAAAVSLLMQLQASMAAQLSGFELIPHIGLQYVLKHISGTRAPLETAAPYYVLIETTDGATDAPLQTQIENEIGAALESGLAVDAVIASNSTQRAELWRIREELPEAQRLNGKGVKFDISMPVSALAAYIDTVETAVNRAFPSMIPVAFGHVGDGNLHYTLSYADKQKNAELLANPTAANHLMYEALAKIGGSISAEHGLGRLKRDEIKQYKSVIELDLMRALKAALDPQNIMNPGRVL
jgi:FAD/FMN-containing dehydrogenase